MGLAVETFDLTREFKSRYVKRMVSFEPTNPHVFFQELIGRITGKVGIMVSTALDHVNIKVEKNEFFGLLGPNGSGKTTLLKVLSGLLRPTSGKATILGYDLINDRNVIVDHVNYIAGLLTGGIWCNPNLSAKRNLEAMANLFNIPTSKVDEVLEFVGLSHLANARVGTFSSGMSARLVIAFGMMRETSFYLMDEPTIGISAEAAREIQIYIKKRVQKEIKATILYATNNVMEAEKLCDRIAILHKGRVLICGKPQDLVRALKRSDVIEIKLLNPTKTVIELLRQRDDVINMTTNSVDVNAFSPKESLLRLRVQDSEDSLPGIVDLIIKKCNGKIKHIDVSKPNLEDVFIQYVTTENVEYV